MNSILKFSTPFLVIWILCSFRINNSTDPFAGVWERSTDRLKISFTRASDQQLRSDIVKEGVEEFPCDISGLAIYQNIRHVRGSIWSCRYLVVTMGSCATEYEDGILKVIDENRIDVHCGSFGKKSYRKLQPRYDSH